MKAIIDSKYCNDQEHISRIINLCHDSRDRYYSKDKILFAEGSRVEGVIYIKSGKAKVFKNGSNKKELIVRFVSEGDIIGVKSTITGEMHTVSAIALDEMQACFIPRENFLILLAHNPDLAYYLINCLSNTLQEAERRNFSIIHNTERQRLAEALITISEKFHSDEIHLLKNDLVGYTKLKRNYLTKYLKSFREHKLIAMNSERIKILDEMRLRGIASCQGG